MAKRLSQRRKPSLKEATSPKKPLPYWNAKAFSFGKAGLMTNPWLFSHEKSQGCIFQENPDKGILIAGTAPVTGKSGKNENWFISEELVKRHSVTPCTNMLCN
jgi:hypothetical protein